MHEDKREKSRESTGAIAYRAALEHTVAEEEFTAVSVRSKLNPPVQDNAAIALPVLDEPDLADRAPLSIPGSHSGRVRYELGALLGSGTTGEVYLAHDRNFERDLAIKFMRKERVGDRTKLLEFIQEARVTARLEHPNILPVYDVNFARGGQIYFTMRRAEGLTLLQALRAAAAGQPAPVIAGIRERIGIFMKLCDAVAYAHSRGVIHQDIKPGNIMLGQFGEVLLVDWGTAASSCDQSASGRKLRGTPAYMAPEQARRERADERSDVYCLGATFFHMLTLRHPTWSADPDEFWRKKQHGIIDPATAEEFSRIPALLLQIALKAMAPEAQDRYASVKELQDGIRAYQTHAESIALGVRARESLAAAVKTGDYAAFNEVAYGFRQALVLWEGNEEARRGLAESRLHHAECALRNGDFELAASVLDSAEPSHAAALVRVQRDRRTRDAQQRRGRRFLYAAAGFVLALGALAGYAAYEYYLSVSSWELVYGPQQYGSIALESLWIVKDMEHFPDSFALERHPDGIRLKKNLGANVLAVLNLPCAGDAKLEFDLDLPPQAHPDGVKIGMFGDSDMHTASLWSDLDGYALHLACAGWTRTMLVKAAAQPMMEIEGAIPRIGTTHHFVVGRDEGILFGVMDGATFFRMWDLLPYLGPKQSRFSFGACIKMDFTVRNLKVYTRVPAQRVRPTAIADVLYERGDFKGALDKYSELIRTYPTGEISEEASAKACALALALATDASASPDGSPSHAALTVARDMALKHLSKYRHGPWSDEVIKTLLVTLVKLHSFDTISATVRDYYQDNLPRAVGQYLCAVIESERNCGVREDNNALIEQAFEAETLVLARLPAADALLTSVLGDPPLNEHTLQHLDRLLTQNAQNKSFCGALLQCKILLLKKLGWDVAALEGALESARKLNPSVAPDADALWNTGKFTAAISAQESLLSRESGPNTRCVTLIGLARYLESIGRHGQAAKFREEAFALDASHFPLPDVPSPSIRSRVQATLERLETILEISDASMLNLKPDNSIRNLANLYEELGRSTEALQIIREGRSLLEAAPFYRLKWEFIDEYKLIEAEYLLRAGRYAEALDAYAHVVEQFPYHQARRKLGEGLALLALHRPDEATAQWRDVIQKYPSVAVGGCSMIARALLGELNPEDAPTLQQIRNAPIEQMHFKIQFTDYHQFQSMLGWLGLKRFIEQKDEEALRLFERANTEYEQEFMPQFYLALCRRLQKTPKPIPLFEVSADEHELQLPDEYLTRILAWRKSRVESARERALIGACIEHLASRDAFVRLAALKELQHLGSAASTALPAIKDLIADPDTAVSQAAVAACAAIGLGNRP